MKVAIIGSGPAGATLYRLLKDKPDMQVDIFGKKESTNCGLKSCAWGVNRIKFQELCNRLGLDSKRYYTNHCKYFYLWGFRIPCDMVMINKALLLQDLVKDNTLYKQPEIGKYDRIIDATGLANGKFHPTFQIKVKARLPLGINIGLFPSLHCLWYFPLSNDTTHVGVLSFVNNADNLEKLKGKIARYKPICQCYSKIHSQGLVEPLVERNVWKVGESAGAVDPITGGGILSSMTSSFILYNNWYNPEGYKKVMASRFSYTTSKLRALFHNEFRGIPIGLTHGN